MEGVGLCEGDIIIVDKRKEPKEDDIVVANVDDQFTLKYFRKIDGKFCLVPGNTECKIIYPNDSLTI